MSDKVLKPCPFCGGEAELIRFVRRSYSYIVPQVVCKNCLAMMGREREDQAIEAWNRRANEVG